MILRWPRRPLQRGTAECLSVSNGRLLLCFVMTNLQSRKNSPRKSHKSQLRNREPRRAQRCGYGAVSQAAYLLGRETNVQDNRYGK